MINHIVLAAGAYKGLYILGALNHLSSINFYNIENIETIHGGSVGGMVGALLCLKIEWEDIIKYVIERPWNKIVKLDSNTIFSLVQISLSPLKKVSEHFKSELALNVSTIIAYILLL